MRINMNFQKNAFSLVELSIVLVILGLLIGGILTGQSLIRAAELRSIIKDFENFKTAVYLFEDKYFALPGDMTNATDFWGAYSDGCPGSSQSGTETCNGNGDGYIFEGTIGQYTESQGFFQHLANAGLIKSNFSPDPGDDIQKKFPENPVGGIWYATTPRGNGAVGGGLGIITANNTRFFAGTYKVILSVERRDAGAGPSPLEIAEVMSIDLKVDDGKPGTGTVFTNERDGEEYGCHDQNSSTTPIAHLAEYTPDGSGPSGDGGSEDETGCKLSFRLN